MCIMSFNLHDNLMSKVLLFLYFMVENWGDSRWTNLAKATQLAVRDLTVEWEQFCSRTDSANTVSQGISSAKVKHIEIGHEDELDELDASFHFLMI